MPAVRGWISRSGTPRCASGSAGLGAVKPLETVTTWSSMTSQILALRDHLIAERITCAVMEATSDYWKPFVRHEALEIEWG
jgi:hypothetical protein